MNLVDNIKKHCEERNMSISDLAERAGIRRTNIYRWDKHPPIYTTVIAIADVLQVSLDELCRD